MGAASRTSVRHEDDLADPMSLEKGFDLRVQRILQILAYESQLTKLCR